MSMLACEHSIPHVVGTEVTLEGFASFLVRVGNIDDLLPPVKAFCFSPASVCLFVYLFYFNKV